MRRRLGSLLLIEGASMLVAWVAIRAAEASGPSTWAGEQVSSWYADASADALVATGGLLVVIGLATWLSLATALQLVAEVVPWASLQLVADRVAPAALRSVGRGMADLALGASVLFAPISVPLHEGPSQVAATEDRSGTATLRPLDPAAPAPVPAEVESVAVAPSVATVVVATGDSFWSIADDVLSRQLGRPASDGETDGYWRQLMADNADRLVVPGNFDLIYPGQVLALPDGPPPAMRTGLAETL